MTTNLKRRMNRLFHVALFGFGAMTGLTAPSHALNSDMKVLICDDCEHLYQFELKALLDAEYNVTPGF